MTLVMDPVCLIGGSDGRLGRWFQPASSMGDEARVVDGIVSGEEEDGQWPPGRAAILFIVSGVPNWERLSQMPNKFVFVREFKMIISQKFEYVLHNFFFTKCFIFVSIFDLSK